MKETIHNFKLNSSKMKFPLSPNKMETANNQRNSKISKCCLWFQKVVKSMISWNFAIFAISKMIKNQNEAKLAKIVHTNSPLEPKTSKTAKSLIIRTFFEFSEISLDGAIKLLAWKWYDSTQIVLLEQFCSNLEQLFQKMYFFESGVLGNIWAFACQNLSV